MDNTLIISDTHFPYQHIDTFDFLKAASKKHRCNIFKHTGDMIDNHSSSYHEVEYGTMSAKEEHIAAYKCVQQLYKMFPKMDVIVGNHGSMSYRKAKSAGIPLDHLKSYNDIYDTRWNWTDKDYFKINNNEKCLLIHSMSTNTLNNAAKHSFNSIQGHHHSKFGIEYFGDCEMLRWSMTVGCLVDMHHPAFNYASGATLSRPVIGCGAIINDKPVLIPMRLNHKGRWVGEI
jgi:predicted phosphodiesterase